MAEISTWIYYVYSLFMCSNFCMLRMRLRLLQFFFLISLSLSLCVFMHVHIHKQCNAMHCTVHRHTYQFSLALLLCCFLPREIKRTNERWSIKRLHVRATTTTTEKNWMPAFGIVRFIGNQLRWSLISWGRFFSALLLIINNRLLTCPFAKLTGSIWCNPNQFWLAKHSN